MHFGDMLTLYIPPKGKNYFKMSKTIDILIIREEDFNNFRYTFDKIIDDKTQLLFYKSKE